jgi:hypothetical protein
MANPYAQFASPVGTTSFQELHVENTAAPDLPLNPVCREKPWFPSSTA